MTPKRPLVVPSTEGQGKALAALSSELIICMQSIADAPTGAMVLAFDRYADTKLIILDFQGVESLSESWTEFVVEFSKRSPMGVRAASLKMRNHLETNGVRTHLWS